MTRPTIRVRYRRFMWGISSEEKVIHIRSDRRIPIQIIECEEFNRDRCTFEARLIHICLFRFISAHVSFRNKSSSKRNKSCIAFWSFILEQLPHSRKDFKATVHCTTSFPPLEKKNISLRYAGPLNRHRLYIVIVAKPYAWLQEPADSDRPFSAVS